MPGAPLDRVFAFQVSPDGKFTFTPPGDWAYAHHDTVTIQSDSGPFTVALKPIVSAIQNPVGGPLTGVLVAPGLWSTGKASIKDGLTPSQRKELMASNATPGDPDGFIARYNYVIKATHNASGKEFDNAEHNGTHDC